MKNLTVLQAGLVLLFSMILITWVKSDKLATYWQQEYETNEPFISIVESKFGQVGKMIDDTVNSHQLRVELQTINQLLNNNVNAVVYKELLEQRRLAKIAKEAEELKAKLESEKAANKKAEELKAKLRAKNVYLEEGKKPIFIGDSLMQGVAPWVMRGLQKYDIQSINLSKPSTGLTVKKFFDWPATFEKALKDDPDINAVFVFLGGNDGQSIIDPETETYVNFGTERWDEVYSDRIKKIIELADNQNIQILWVNPPHMKSKRLNTKMARLATLFRKNFPESRGVMLNSKEILQFDTTRNKYSDSMRLNGKLIKVRTSDGVHFTIRGQQVIAKSIMQKIYVNEKPMLVD